VNAEVVLACQFDKIEIWSKAAYEAQFDKEPADFAILAEELLGNKNRRPNGE
jgi:MraZ protein